MESMFVSFDDPRGKSIPLRSIGFFHPVKHPIFRPCGGKFRSHQCYGYQESKHGDDIEKNHLQTGSSHHGHVAQSKEERRSHHGERHDPEVSATRRRCWGGIAYQWGL